MRGADIPSLRDILCHRVMRHVGAQLTESYDRERIMLIRNGVTEGLVGQYVEIYHFADGQVDVRWKRLSLPYAVFDKEQRARQAEVVENKRLGTALALVKARQDTPQPSPRVKSASEAGGYVKRVRKSSRKPWLPAGTTRTASTMVPPSDTGLKAAVVTLAPMFAVPVGQPH